MTARHRARDDLGRLLLRHAQGFTAELYRRRLGPPRRPLGAVA